MLQNKNKLQSIKRDSSVLQFHTLFSCMHPSSLRFYPVSIFFIGWFRFRMCCISGFVHRQEVYLPQVALLRCAVVAPWGNLVASWGIVIVIHSFLVIGWDCVVYGENSDRNGNFTYVLQKNRTKFIHLYQSQPTVSSFWRQTQKF